jgi:lysyl-tRNA synthetase, class II
VTDHPVDPATAAAAEARTVASADAPSDAAPGDASADAFADAFADASDASGDASADASVGETKLDEIVATRHAKVVQLRDAGVEPYPVRFRPSDTLAQVRAAHADLEPGAETGVQVTVAGRLVARREMGRLRFLVLREDGVDLQLFCPVKALDEGSRALLDHLDVGDWLGATGEVMASNKGELSVRPATLTLLAKGLRPLPDKWHGLTDTEARFRQREVDLVVNPEARRVFEIRSAVLKALRAEMDERGFVEVETPMLHPIPGGATAKPFVTHHNALDTDLFLRIAPELYLKRLIAGGMRRVYEINRNFRNEGMSARHNPEFTMLESYAAYDDYHDVMELTEALIQRAATEALGTLELSYQGRAVSLAAPFRRAPLLELTREAAGHPELAYDLPLDDLRAICDEHDVPWDAAFGPGKLVLELFEKLVEPHLWDPTFVLDYPVEVSPLARKHRSEPHVTERFELIVTGRELANAFSELIDPADQRERFEAQARAKAAGDEEAMVLDEPYLRAMELGLPPTGGLGLGVDRVVMLLADVANIRDVILFPTLRPERA